MSNKCLEEFNPWPSFVDIFSSVILVMLLFLLITLVNLGYYTQFKYKVSFTGSIATEDMVILNNNRSSEPNDPNTTKVTDPRGGPANSDTDVKIIKEDESQVMLLRKQLSEQEAFASSKEKAEELESPGMEVADIRDKKTDRQDVLETKDYIIVTYKGNELFVDDVINRKIKQFLSKAKETLGKHKIEITAEDTKGQLSATIAKQISLGRTISTRNLIRKFGYEKKDVQVNLSKTIPIKENINDKNGYLIISIKK
jgi:hypothetical protein